MLTKWMIFGLRLIAAVVTLSVSAHAVVTVDFTRQVGGGSYPGAGGTVDVTVTFTASGTGTVTNLAIEETIPAGWTYNSRLSAGTFFVEPTAGDAGPLAFAYNSIPTFPATLQYRLNVPAGQTGTKQITGTAAYNGGTPDDLQVGPKPTDIPPQVAIAVQFNTDNSSVPEGSTATFGVKLSAQPAGSTVVAVSRTSGDTDISVQSGGSLTFTTANWNVDQTVTLAAAQDADTANGSATIQGSGTGLTSASLTATESDDDPVVISVPNVVGLAQDAATTTIETAGLVIGTVTQVSSGTVPVGQVISQSPLAGTLVSPGAFVSIAVSSGPGNGTPPTIVLSSNTDFGFWPNPGAGLVWVHAELSAESTDFSKDDISVSNAIVGSFTGAGKSYGFQLIPASEGEFFAVVNSDSFTDSGALGNTASNVLQRSFNRIVVRFPNEGSTLRKNRTYKVSWFHSDDTKGKVRIELWRKGEFVELLAERKLSPPNQSLFETWNFPVEEISWQVPSSLREGKGYKIRVVSVSKPERWDESDKAFKIKSAKSSR